MSSSHPVRYPEVLQTVLDQFSSKSIFSEKDIDCYILAFSFFLSAGDDAYRYHTDYLARKHAAFREFLRVAENKLKQLGNFITQLTGDKEIDRWRRKDPTQAGELCISLDDFCQGDLEGKVSLCEEVSIKGARWGKNIITVHLGKQTASFFCPVSDEDLKRAARIVLSLAKDSREGRRAK